MASNAQIEANRVNAQFSTGPRTFAGKRRSAGNSMTHGLTARPVLLPGEDPVLWEALRNEIFAEYQPRPGVEQALVETIAICVWRLARSRNIETDILRAAMRDARQLSEQCAADDQGLAVAFAMGQSTLEKILRHQGAYSRELYRAMHELERIQARRAGRDVSIPAVVDINISEPTENRVGPPQERV